MGPHRLARVEPESNGPAAGRTSRRALLRAAGAGALAMTGGSGLPAAIPSVAAHRQAGRGITVFPRHGTFTASPHTEISFRGTTEEELGTVSVEGSVSGGHSGLLMPHADGNGVSYLPDSWFEPGERVTVWADEALGPGDGGSLEFGVARPAELALSPAERVIDDPREAPHQFRSRPDLRPPVINVTEQAEGIAAGYIILGASVPGGQNGALIVDNSGEPIWFSPAENVLDRHYDVRVQEYRGEPVITFAEANGPTGYRLGHYVICNRAYERIAEFQIGNGLAGGDHHEFLVTARDTAIVGAYHGIVWDLSSVGGPSSGKVMDYVIQELEIDTGRVL
ncbi:MAG TPA: arylsulfotransferase family protein, partial [Thermomicrobiales bacterium]|nr:arylsulfotransferase family protein [Thermomicrobiales bacterium]